ncbi:MAG: alpha-L-fucosidase [Melioribacteraceae bacterium]|nr:alpha-L-fucosidase [Melioribacteraceae bacterium]MCF8353319.1 alpha-L-fucosidase [Melioribacteraceae bacterium]MCF8393183.1 alpha-L-fucosidase [Melioribacteraceae bacterium]MCF8419045.1 alpha-L-fucosidase [Melioribacteraceae bacterium]
MTNLNSGKYFYPKDDKVLANLNKWREYKFGVLIHFGLYSHLGVVESWGLCPEDEEWINRSGFDNYFEYVQNYRNAISKFNPLNFDPVKWARAIKNSGAQYVIFSAKHHDGFALFDTAQSDFKITNPRCPFSQNSKSNITKEVLDACRDEGLAVGIYFSKPDWSSPYYWWEYFPPIDRNPNYDITKYPERWNKFVEYTHAQLKELLTEYGKIDILWLDGTWVRPKHTINKQVESICKYPHDLDINIQSIAKFAREKQPWLIIVDRWVGGEYENYLTPEQKIPDEPINVPWESCITLTKNWGWVENDEYKSPEEIIQMLTAVNEKGGNLLLGIGPTGKGDFEIKVYDSLKKIGELISE